MTQGMSVVLFRMEGRCTVPLAAANGPWMPDVLSGTALGPMAAAQADEVSASYFLELVSRTTNFLGRVPARPLDIYVPVVREGQKHLVLEFEISSAGNMAVGAAALRSRNAQTGMSPSTETDGSAFKPPPGPRYDPGMPGEHVLLDWFDSHFIEHNGIGPQAPPKRGCATETRCSSGALSCLPSSTYGPSAS